METEHTWLSEHTKSIDGLKGELHAIFVWDNVVITNLREEELLVSIEDEWSHVLLKIAHHAPSVVIISDSTTIHGFTDEVSQSFPRKFLVTRLNGLVEVHGNELIRNGVVTHVEVIRDIPSDLTEFLSLLDNRMEERENVKHWLELKFGASLEDFLREL